MELAIFLLFAAFIVFGIGTTIVTIGEWRGPVTRIEAVVGTFLSLAELAGVFYLFWN